MVHHNRCRLTRAGGGPQGTSAVTTLFPIESTEAVPAGARRDHAPQYLRLDAEVDGAISALPAATLIRGRAADALDLLPIESVRTVVTSPPYWSLRDYDVGDPFGRDDTLGDYVANIVADFRKLRRVLTATAPSG